MGQPEAGQDVGARALSQPDDVLDVQEVQHRDELFAEQLQRRKLEVFCQIWGIVSVAGNVDVDEAGSFLDFDHARTVDELFE